MRNTVLEKTGHLSNETIILLKNGKLAADETMEALMHIGECRICADFFADCYAEDELLDVFPDFSERIIREASRPGRRVETAGIGGRRADRRDPAARMREFYLYATKVALAMCLSLAMLFAGPFQTVAGAVETADFGEAGQIGISKVDAFNEQVWSLTDKLTDMGVFELDIDKLEGKKHDQKEK